ncbi:MAG: glycosyltransferase [Rickettsiales bacterium]
MPFSLDIAICTLRREHVAETMASLTTIENPEELQIRLLVADNDDTPSAEQRVVDAARALPFLTEYLHAPARNISIARNACLDAAKADLVAFLDDDEIVTPHWLNAMLATQRQTGADVVLGPVQATYSKTAPSWLARGDFHSTRPVWVKGKITTGYSGNVLMLRTAQSLHGLRFNEAYGVTGGEDTDFFSRAHKAGAQIAYAPDAIAYEQVPDDRANLKWLIRRHARYGQTHAIGLLAQNRPRLQQAALATAKAAICWTMIPLGLLHPFRKQTWLLRGTLHAAAARHLLSAKN